MYRTYLKDIRPSDVTKVEGTGRGAYSLVTVKGKQILIARCISYLVTYWPHLTKINRSVAVCRGKIASRDGDTVTLTTGEQLKIARRRRGNCKIQPTTV